MRMLWCLLGFSLVLLHAEGRSTNNNNNNGHPLDNDKWLSDVSQYDKDRYWNKFRDEDYFRTWSPSKPVEQDTEARRGRRTEPVSKTTAVVAKWRSEDGVDGTKDPCMKVRCPPHKVCITHDYQTAVCTNHRQPPHSVPPVRSGLPHKRWMGAGPHGRCPACPLHHSSLVCGSDGHTYASKCKLEFQACTMGKTISMKCEGPCPCLPGWETVKHKAEKNVCNDKELRNLASRLKDWFGILHKDANRDLKSAAMSDAGQGRFDTSILPICKDSLGWMFNKLDMNYDLLLDNTELSAIYLDKHELCLKPLFNSCDSFKDGKLSNNEWCYCFQKPDGLPCQNEMKRIQSQGRRKSLLGTFIPRCNDEGYFKPTQCHGSQCWCVDKYGNEIAGSRKQGNPACEEDSEGSGDLGSGAVVLLDDQEEEQHAPNPVRRLRPRGADEDDEEDEDDQESDWGLFY